MTVSEPYAKELGRQIEELEAENERLRAALTDARNKLRQYGEWREPSANLLIDLADEVDAALSQQITEKEKCKPYSRGCLARDIPGATCQSPNCDC